MIDDLARFFSADGFMPHGHCYLWTPGLVWLQLLTNLFIGAAYMAISGTLAYLVYSIRDIPFRWMYLAFGIFIVTCGFTHFFDVWTIWTPVYWLDGGVRFVTAVASVGTAVLLPPLVPKAVAIARGAKAAHDRGIHLEAAVEELATLYERTKELDESKTQFFANVSHELRTPLALILGPTERVLARDDVADDARRDLEVVARNARTLLKHVNDLLDASRLEAHAVTADYVRTDLARLARVVAGNFEGHARDREIRFELDIPSSLPAEVDSDKVQRVLLNLLSNAFKFTPKGGTIRMTLKREKNGRDAEKVRLTVADSGPGVRLEQRSLIFERFRQGDGGTARQLGGTGLGLAIVKDFVELHGGKVTVGDAPEGGALFEVELPSKTPAGTVVGVEPGSVSTEQVNAEMAALQDLGTRVLAAAAVDGGEPPLVVVVEDNPEMNSFVRSILADYRVESAFDGEEGLRKVEQLRPDLVISDVMMPRMSGDQLVRAVRAQPELDAIPIVMLTAKADDELRVTLLREGAQDYVMKPFSMEELSARVKNLVIMKRARDVLQSELGRQLDDLEELAKEVTTRKRELQVAIDAMRIARDQAVHASHARMSFLSMVSHELRTPLTSLRLHLQRLGLEKEGLTERQRGMLVKMDTSSQRLLDLVEALLRYSKIRSGSFLSKSEDVDVEATVGEAVDMMQPMADEKRLTLELHAERKVGTVKGDASGLRLIAMNLVDNAIKYSDEGRIDVELEPRDGSYTLRVRDTGRGIPLSDQVRVFEAFEQLEPVRYKHTPGVGLGLALVREMVEALDGTIELQSEPGQGTTVEVTLPRMPEQTAQDEGHQDDRRDSASP